MFLPRDGHLEMNMLQSIYKVFWTDLLSPMNIFLGWKLISRDICAYYFQAARLMRCVHNSMSTYLLRCYISLMYNDISKIMTTGNELNVLYGLVVQYLKWISNGLKSITEHLRLGCHVLNMSAIS